MLLNHINLMFVYIVLNKSYILFPQESNIENIPKVLPLLKQAACLGNYDAMYMLSVILNNGLMVKADEIQVR